MAVLPLPGVDRVRRLGVGGFWLVVHEHAGRPRLVRLPGEDGLGLFFRIGGRFLGHFVPHVLGRGGVPLRRDERGRVRGHGVVRVREVDGLGLGVGRWRVPGWFVSLREARFHGNL